jgi:Protein of unknown function (DUF4038)/Putative collagen-binding domain of a collagenase
MTEIAPEQNMPLRSRGEAAFPLRVHASGRYLIDQSDAPFLAVGDSPWSLFVREDYGSVIDYLDKRAAQGFNTLVTEIVENALSYDPPRNHYGDAPFARPSGFDIPTERYFSKADSIIRAAGDRGMLLMMSPLYLGYRSPGWQLFRGLPDGFAEEALAAGPELCRRYGRFLGERYRDFGNILWVMCGDRDPGPLLPHMRALAEGIQSAWPDALFTAHVHPGHPPREVLAGEQWLNVGAAYSYGIVHRAVFEEWRRSPAMPTFLFESAYENMHQAPGQQLRRAAYWSVLAGGFGHCYGNDPVFWFGPGWRGQLDSAGAQGMTLFGDFFRGLEWWRLKPDIDASVGIDGLGAWTDLDRTTVAVADDRSFAVAYLPIPRPLKVDPQGLAGSRISVIWFDPRSGSRTEDNEIDKASGPRTLRAPGQGDWVLTLASIS